MASMTRREALEANGGDGTLLDWTARFGTEEACEAELLRRMWPEGFRCPSCGGDRCSRVRGRAHKWQCTRCSRQFSVTAGTAMRGTKLPLAKWFLAVYLLTHSKRVCLVKSHLRKRARPSFGFQHASFSVSGAGTPLAS